MAHHYVFRVARPLDEAFGWLANTAKGIQPMLWSIDEGDHRVPYKFDDNNATENQEVTLYKGTPAAQVATRVGTGCQTSCAHGGYLVSDGYQSCVPVIGLSGTKTYLAHLDAIVTRHTLFSTWEKDMQVMIVRKTGPANHTAKMDTLKEFLDGTFTGGSFIQDVNWRAGTGVIVRRSTCIAYREDWSD